ncbi:unnamed protein product [Aureobasidium pullulans]|nr:unnamed protein product [Aureobasidium pullulans]
MYSTLAILSGLLTFITFTTTVTAHGFVQGISAKSTNTRIPVKAGDKVKLLWSDWPQSHKGPVISYLAKCPGDCSIVNPTTLDWFKIDQAGLINGNPAPGYVCCLLLHRCFFRLTTIVATWASDTLIANNNSWTVTIPSSLIAGSYVLRHEIIALHSADQANGAQNYPNCINFQISGKGTAKPAGVKATKLYSATSKSIAISIYWPVLKSYTIPGPALWKGAVKRWVERIFEA